MIATLSLLVLVLSWAPVGVSRAAEPQIVPAQSGAAPRAGLFLVARQDLPDPNFFETVVLLLAYGEEEGAAGVVINRRSEVPVSEVVDEDSPLAARTDPLYQGGPVSLNTLVVLFHGEAPSNGAERILDGVHVINEGLADLIATAPEAASMRFYAGYAGWSAGQLEGEIANGVWHLVAGDPRWVFSADPEEAWRALLQIAIGPQA